MQQATNFFHVDLSGVWRTAAADEALRRAFHRSDFDDGSWETVTVPGHWSDTPALRDLTSVLYRHRFEHSIPGEVGGRSWLELDGIFYQGDVWLDGNYLGDTEGYFVRHGFDVTDMLRSASEHELAVEVNCSPAGEGSKSSALLGVFDGHNDMVPSGNPGGIWAPVRLRHTGPVRIGGVRAICLEADPNRAVIGIRTTLVSVAPRSVHIVTEIGGVEHRADHPIAAGVNEVEWRVEVRDPELWWPHRLGDQPLYQLDIRVETRQDEISDQHGQRIGLRSVAVRRWQTFVNGERIFLKGANLAPANVEFSKTNTGDVDRQLDLALGAGLDLVRPYAHVAHDMFYERADEIGMLVWQDLPLLGAASSGLRSQAVRQAGAMVSQLAHHPCIYTWNAHVSPAPQWMEPAPPTARRALAKFAAHQLPTWTKSVLDRSIKRVFDAHDGSRNCTAFSGVLPHLPRVEACASHLWFGWRRGSERDLPEFAARWPAQVAFIAEFGAQSLPSDPDFIDTSSWPELNWAELNEQYGYDGSSFDRYIPPHGHATFESWQEATQLYQAGLLRRQIETLRRLKYQPTGGFCVHHLVDAMPGATASLVDSTGRPKLAYQALADACRPVIAVADRLPAKIRPGEAIALDVHVVSDLPEKLTGARIEAELRWPGDVHYWRFEGDIDADSVIRVGTLSWVAPDAPGLVTLTIRLSGPVEAVSRYDTTIRAK